LKLGQPVVVTTLRPMSAFEILLILAQTGPIAVRRQDPEDAR